MALGREVHDSVAASDHLRHNLWVCDVALDEAVAWIALQTPQVVEIARVGQFIEHHDFVIAVREDVADVVAPDESSATRNQDPHEIPSPTGWRGQ